MHPKTKALYYLHIAVFLWGFTAILGKLIGYGAFNLVWHRMVLAAAVYCCFPNFWKSVNQLSKKDIAVFLGIGFIVALHWCAFYGSIKIGNSASITLACLGTASIFSAIFDPIINKRKFNMYELLLGTFCLAGMWCLYKAKPQTISTDKYTLTILTGVLAAALAALFTALNKKYIHKTTALCLSNIEMISGAIFLSICALLFPNDFTVIIPSFSIEKNNYDMLWLLLLGIFCTNFTFWLASISLKHISAFTANLSVNLEPIYGIILSIIFFKENEMLNTWFYFGAVLIILSVFLNPVLAFREKS